MDGDTTSIHPITTTMDTTAKNTTNDCYNGGDGEQQQQQVKKRKKCVRFSDLTLRASSDVEEEKVTSKVQQQSDGNHHRQHVNGTTDRMDTDNDADCATGCSSTNSSSKKARKMVKSNPYGVLPMGNLYLENYPGYSLSSSCHHHLKPINDTKLD